MLKVAVFLVLACSFLTACFEPVANRKDDIENEPERETEIANTSVNTTDAASEKPENINTTENTKMSEPKIDTPKKAEGFRGNLNQHIGRQGLSITQIVDEGNDVERRLLHEYGAVFLTKAVPPSKVMFTSESEVTGFQSKAGVAKANLAGITVELQPDAANALKAAANEASASGLSITPRDPKDSARRSYAHTHKLWKGRFEKACDHWMKKGKLNGADVSKLKAMPIKQQVSEVLNLEKRGIYFSTNFDKSILYSVAAPGTSQHLSMLAFDAKEFGNKKVREIMAKHGWYRTVQSDEPHFTYLGYPESELPSLGLKKVSGGFWIPNV